MNNNTFLEFLDLLKQSVSTQKLVKISLSKTFKVENNLKNIFITPVLIKGKHRLSFTYHYGDKDLIKNYGLEDAFIIIKKLIGTSFLQALLKTEEEEIQLLVSKKMTAKIFRNKLKSLPSNLEHNKKKKDFISATGNIYLKELGITDSNGRIKDKQQDKFRQINRYIELVGHWFEKIDLPKKINIVDVGSGKGYLTFALYDYLTYKLNLNVTITGVELRGTLVNLCNNIKEKCEYENLHFSSKDINDFKRKDVDIIIALHACDTATDLAIQKGINSNARLIICAPCCHKQVRKDMNSTTQFNCITKHGIFKERQAEMVTDSIRSLLMEREGYHTKAFEFISNEHTRKNIMLIGKKHTQTVNKNILNEEIEQLKIAFGVERQELEDLLN